MQNLRKIALFPLPMVLFPRCVVPLHIFEPRYRTMIAEVQSGMLEFGILPKAPGLHEEDIPVGTVGCIARVERADLLPDGRSNIVVSGTTRFQFSGYASSGTPYRYGEVTVLPDRGAPPPSSLVHQTRAAYAELALAAGTVRDDSTDIPPMPDDPTLLAFAIAHTVEFSLDQRVRILGEDDQTRRLALVLEMLAPAREAMERHAQLHQRAKTNGHHH